MTTRAIIYDTNTSTTTNTSPLIIIPGLRVTGLTQSVVERVNTYTALTTDDIVLCNNATSMTVILPVASATGHILQIKNINNVGSVTVDANVGGGKIDDELTQEVASYENLTIVDGLALKWYIL